MFPQAIESRICEEGTVYTGICILQLNLALNTSSSTLVALRSISFSLTTKSHPAPPQILWPKTCGSPQLEISLGDATGTSACHLEAELSWSSYQTQLQSTILTLVGTTHESTTGVAAFGGNSRPQAHLSGAYSYWRARHQTAKCGSVNVGVLQGWEWRYSASYFGDIPVLVEHVLIPSIYASFRLCQSRYR